MFDWVLSLLVLAQGDGGAGGAGAGGAAGGGGAGGGGGGFLGDASFLPVMAVIGLMFYLMLIRPEQKRKSQVAQMQQGLKKNDRIVTIGGIYGTVVNTGQGAEDVTIRIDDSSNTRMRIERGAIKRIIVDDKSSTDENKKESD